MHYKAEFLIDEIEETMEISLNDLEGLFEDFPGGYKRALLLALMQYRIEKGVPVSRLHRKVRINDGN